MRVGRYKHMLSRGWMRTKTMIVIPGIIIIIFAILIIIIMFTITS